MCSKHQEGKFFAVIARVLSTYLDESSDKRAKKTLCIGSMLLNDACLKEIESAWAIRVQEAGIDYFRFADCKGLHGEFFHYRKKYSSLVEARTRAEAVLSDLEKILLSTSWVGFTMGILIPEYAEILRDVPVSKLIYRDDPTELAYGQMLFEIAREVRKNAKGFQVAYFIDESSDYPKIAEVFAGVKTNHPIIGKTMATVAPLNDKQVPALQMADLIAGMTREAFIRWVETGRPNRPIFHEKWHNHLGPTWIWDKDHMIRTIWGTLNSHKMRTATLATRLRSKPSSSDTRRAEKTRRKELMKKKNEAKSSIQ